VEYDRITIKTKGGVLIDLVEDQKYIVSKYWVTSSDIDAMVTMGINGDNLTKALATQLMQQNLIKRRKS